MAAKQHPLTGVNPSTISRARHRAQRISDPPRLGRACSFVRTMLLGRAIHADEWRFEDGGVRKRSHCCPLELVVQSALRHFALSKCVSPAVGRGGGRQRRRQLRPEEHDDDGSFALMAVCIWLPILDHLIIRIASTGTDFLGSQINEHVHSTASTVRPAWPGSPRAMLRCSARAAGELVVKGPRLTIFVCNLMGKRR